MDVPKSLLLFVCLSGGALAQPALYQEASELIAAAGHFPDPDKLQDHIAREAARWLSADYSQAELLEALQDREATLAVLRGTLKATEDPVASLLEAAPIRCTFATREGRVGVYLQSPHWLIEGVVEGSPADQARLRAGDRVLAIDGKSVAGHSRDWVNSHLHGEPGEARFLLLEREGVPLTVEILLQKLPETFCSYRMLEHGIGYLHISYLTEETPQQVRAVLPEDQNLGGLVVDLRDSPGGYYWSATQTAGCFLPTGSPVLRLPGSLKVLKVQGHGKPSCVPVVVLINQQTSGASEVLAAALHDVLGAPLVGQPTAGRALSRQVYRLSSGDLLTLSDGVWSTPAGTVLTSAGLKPDCVVAQETDLDSQLEAALKLFN